MVEHFHSAFMCDFRENRVTDKLFAAKWAVSQRYRKNIVPFIFIVTRCTLYSKITVASILGHIDTAKHHSFSKPIDVYSSPAKNLQVFTIIAHNNSPLQKEKSLRFLTSSLVKISFFNIIPCIGAALCAFRVMRVAALVAIQ